VGPRSAEQVRRATTLRMYPLVKVMPASLPLCLSASCHVDDLVALWDLFLLFSLSGHVSQGAFIGACASM
jgi:hypothetical protein